MSNQPQNQSGRIRKEASLTIPCIEEEIEIAKIPVVTGSVTIRKVVSEQETLVDETLSVGTVEIEHVTLNVPIDSPVSVRWEGDTAVFPVMEEIITITKQLILKEEIRVKQAVKQTHSPQQVILRREEIIVEREQSPVGAQQTKGSPGQ
jgi:stress response protein YsnF